MTGNVETKGQVVAALGPTNTGKTYRAIERMLEFDSGVMGFPLRLLAREVYDRVTAKVGEGSVALITGEERRVPKRPRYFICTVEAMPPSLEVEFVAIDEIQLAAHRERGHVFTDRLLHTRGTKETWFLGSSSVRHHIEAIAPTVRVESQARFSELTYQGRSGLTGLPPRSAIVAFSSEGVYELAERIRRRRGGAAVVLGALSPRTRNAQVAMYQSGEVPYLVATDAIGMGLNLEIEHVAFAGLRKYDGREFRELSFSELGQIAGRAGRYRQDGTFGVTGDLKRLGDPVVRAIESHAYPKVGQLVWRNSDLDFSSVQGLIESLAEPPPSMRFSRVERADDFDALRALAGQDEVMQRATSDEARALLWEVCQVPDYRKLALHRHITLLERVYCQLVDHGRLQRPWVESQIQHIDRLDGEIDSLTARLSAVRVWTYISHRADWLDDAAYFQERTRTLEDQLGDALHERLVERFVEKKVRGKHRNTRAQAPSGHPFAGLSQLLAVAEDEHAGWVEKALEAEYASLSMTFRGEVQFEGKVLGTLKSGRSVLLPEVSVNADSFETAGERARAKQKLVAFSKDLIEDVLSPLRKLMRETPSPAARGFLYLLEQGLGVQTRKAAESTWLALAPGERKALQRAGVHFGQQVAFVPGLFDSAAVVQRRATLVRLTMPPREALTLLRDEFGAWFRHDGAPREALLRLGYLSTPRLALRVDVAEEILSLGGQPGSSPSAGATSPERPSPEQTRRRIARTLGLNDPAQGRPTIADALSLLRRTIAEDGSLRRAQGKRRRPRQRPQG